jgi:hypothetical protein
MSRFLPVCTFDQTMRAWLGGRLTTTAAIVEITLVQDTRK